MKVTFTNAQNGGGSSCISNGGVEECISTETIIQPRPIADKKPRI